MICRAHNGSLRVLSKRRYVVQKHNNIFERDAP